MPLSTDEKNRIFAILRALLLPHADTMDCTINTTDDYELFTRHLMKNKKPLYFGGVKINKSFVSYHLMPLYVYPELKDSLSPELVKLLQGKSCFNITRLNKELSEELHALTLRCITLYKNDCYL